MIRWAAVTHPVSRSELKYSRVYPIRGPIWWTPADLVDPPDPAMPGLWRLHDSVTEVDLRSTILGLVGGLGKVAGSGVLWNMMLGFLGSSTDKEADQEVSPLSELAVQVYSAVSSLTKSEKKSFNMQSKVKENYVSR